MSDAEAEVREPLLKFLRQHYVNVPADARASELKKLAMPFGRGDPLRVCTGPRGRRRAIAAHGLLSMRR